MRETILHLDGDAFFASVEQALDPRLKGKPVMTGAERGIVAAFSYEAKARGIVRGMQTWKAKEQCPDLIVRSSDYRTYKIFSVRATAIMRRHVPVVEQYGIDECFARVPGSLADGERAARRIQADLLKELDVGYSIGVAPTKMLAKVGSKWNKPRGITVVSEDVREDMLRQLPVGKLWGVGRRMAPRLMARGIHTAYDLAAQDEIWVARNLSKPYVCMWAELRGMPAMGHERERDHRGSVQKTRTFWPATSNRRSAWGELVQNIERACERLREERLLARGVSVFLKTQQFQYRTANAALSFPTAYPEDVIARVKPMFDTLFRADDLYRATGVTLWETDAAQPSQHRLFGDNTPGDPALRTLYAAIDSLNADGRKVWLGASPKPSARKKVFRLPLLGGSA